MSSVPATAGAGMANPSVRVSSRSMLEDDLWHLDATTPGAILSEFTLDWRFALDDGSSFGGERWRLLRFAAKTFLWSLATAPPAGRRCHRVATLTGEYRKLRVLIKWMVSNGYDRFDSLSCHATESFLSLVSQRPGRRGEKISRSTIRSYVNLLDLLYLQRMKVPQAPKEPIVGRKVVRDVQAGSRRPSVGPATPDDVAIPLINAAIRLIGAPADEIIDRHDQLAALGLNEAGWLSSGAIGAAETTGLVHRLYEASFVVIAYLIGARVSEILSLQAGCVESVSLVEGGEPFEFVYGKIYKTAACPQGEAHRWIAPAPVLRAIAVLERLSAPLRRATGRSDLWLRQRTSSDGEIEVYRSTVLNARLNGAFAAFIELPQHDGRPWHLTTHQGRKTFARFVGRRDRTGLHALASHFGHVTRVMTDNAYVGVDYHLAELIDAEVLAETRDALEDLLTATKLGGKAGRIITSGSRFRGRVRHGDVGAYIDFILRESDMRLGVCDWGYCVYRRETSACLGGETGPNPTLRTQSTCAKCANFAVTDRYRPVWTARRERNRMLLAHPDLDGESRAVATARIKECERILSDLDSGESGHVTVHP